MSKPALDKKLINDAFQAILGQAPDGTVRWVQTDDSGNLTISSTQQTQLIALLAMNISDYLAQLLVEARLQSQMQHQAYGMLDDLSEMRADLASQLDSTSIDL